MKTRQSKHYRGLQVLRSVCLLLLSITIHHHATAFSLLAPTVRALESQLYATVKKQKRNSQSGGGRTSSQPDMPNLPNDDEESNPQRWQPKPLAGNECRLTVVQITDVYTLANFASLKTMLQETRQQLLDYQQDVSGSAADIADKDDEDKDNHSHSKKQDEDLYLTKSHDGVISMLTGDFLAPYLLSSVDRGKGMMRALRETPIDYLTWGNHEADIDHRTVCRHVQNFATESKRKGIWLNSNMKDHEAMEYQQDYDIVEITSPDGSQTRRIGLVAVLSDDPDLYSHFKPPGAFGGATLDDPWKTLQEYSERLQQPPYNCDMILPLQHLYVPDDHKTCQQFDFPVVLSGHDHHRVDELVHGTRLLKPGLDAIYATVLEIVWNTPQQAQPTIRARFVKTSDWAPDAELDEINERAYDSLAPLRDTELARIPPNFVPLSSVNSRGKVCSMGRFVCSLLKSSLNTQRRQRAHRVDACLLMGGNIRGGTEYPVDAYFSLEALEAEIKPDESVAVVAMPGWLLAQGILETHAGDPIPGWMQYDDGIVEENGEIKQVNGRPLEPQTMYRVATKISDLTNGQSPSWTEYFTEHPKALPTKGAYVNIYAELMGFFSRNVWRKLWEAITPMVVAEEQGTSVEEMLEDESIMGEGANEECIMTLFEDPSCHTENNCLPERRLSILDVNNEGVVTVEDIHTALSDILHLSVDTTGTEMSLAEFVHSFADADNDGVVTLDDLQSFCDEMPEIYENQKWRLAFPRPEKLLLLDTTESGKKEETATTAIADTTVGIEVGANFQADYAPSSHCQRHGKIWVLLLKYFAGLAAIIVISQQIRYILKIAGKHKMIMMVPVASTQKRLVVVLSLVLLVPTITEARSLDAQGLAVGDWDVQIRCGKNFYNSLLFPKSSFEVHNNNNKFNKDKRIFPKSFPPPQIPSVYQGQLSLFPNGTFTLRPASNSVSQPEQDLLYLRGRWKVESNPYCITDRFYDKLHLESYPRKLVAIPKRQRLTLTNLLAISSTMQNNPLAFFPWKEKRTVNQQGASSSKANKLHNNWRIEDCSSLSLQMHCHLCGRYTKPGLWGRVVKGQKQKTRGRLTHGVFTWHHHQRQPERRSRGGRKRNSLTAPSLTGNRSHGATVVGGSFQGSRMFLPHVPTKYEQEDDLVFFGY